MCHTEELHDAVRMPHRRLTPAEMQIVFADVEKQISTFYLPLAEQVTEEVEQANARLTQATKDMLTNPRYAALHADWDRLMSTPTDNDAIREEIRSAVAELDALKQPVQDAEKAVKAAQRTYTMFLSEEDEAIQVTTYLAGQRSGLRLGVRLAFRAWSLNQTAAGLDLTEEKPTGEVTTDQFALKLAVAMVDDAQADALIEAALASDNK